MAVCCLASVVGHKTKQRLGWEDQRGWETKQRLDWEDQRGREKQVFITSHSPLHCYRSQDRSFRTTLNDSGETAFEKFILSTGENTKLKDAHSFLIKSVYGIDKKDDEINVIETKVVQKKIAEKKGEEGNGEETKVDEKKVEETKVDEKKVNEKKGNYFS